MPGLHCYAGFSLAASSGGCIEWKFLITAASLVAGLWGTDSAAVAHRLRLLLHRMWNLPGLGIEPVSPALAGGFFTTEAPGKPRKEHVSSLGSGDDTHAALCSLTHSFKGHFHVQALSAGGPLC